MKKICLTLLCLCLIFALVACGEAVTLQSAVVDENGDLILTMSDGTTHNAGKVTGEKGDKGDNAADDPENPQGLDFYLLPDGTYAVSAGKAIYLEEVTIPATYKGKPVTCVGLPEGIDDDLAETMGLFGFFLSPYLKKITLPDSVTQIGMKAFEGCINLTDIVLPSNLAKVGEDAFYGCDKLNCTVWENGKYLGNAENPYLYLASVGVATDFVFASGTKFFDEYAFRGSTTLKSITLPATVTKIPYGMFAGCTALESVTIPSGVTEIEGNAFYNCTSLTSITIPSSVTEIEGNAFYNCTSLASITIPSGVTEIEESVFCNCSSLTTIVIPDTVTEIKREAFYGCTLLDTVTFGANSQLKKIEYSAFAKSGLTSVTIPSRVNYLYKNAFTDCKMMRVVFENTSGWFAAYGEATTGTALDVSDPAVNAYKLTGYHNPNPSPDGDSFADRDNLGNGPVIWKRN